MFLLFGLFFLIKMISRTQIELRDQVKQLREERNYFSKEIKGITSDLTGTKC